ncbi:MAG: hypothetical protein ACP5H7_02285, partial [Minisyncoccia bacterium]
GLFVAVASSGTGNRVMTSGKAESISFSANNLYQGGMNIYGNVGIGTTTPAYKLTVNGTIFANKITVGTIDPIYEIEGEKYATYGLSMVGGVKEEYSGKGKLQKKEESGKDVYEYVIDFEKEQKDSPLWVWFKIVDFSKDNVEVIVTPYGDFANIYYFIEKNKIIFRGDKEIEFSFRLTGKRFDWQKWNTKIEDKNDKEMTNLKVEK